MAAAPFALQPDWQVALLSSPSLLRPPVWLFDHEAGVEYTYEFDGAATAFKPVKAVATRPKGSSGDLPAPPPLEYYHGFEMRGVSACVRVGSGATPLLVAAPAATRRSREGPPSSAMNGKPLLSRVGCVALDGDGAQLAFGAADGTLAVHRLVADSAAGAAASASSPSASGDAGVECEGHLADVNVAAWFPSNKVVLTGASDLGLRLWDAATGRCAATLRGHFGGITGAAIVDRGRNVVSVARDRFVRLWQVATGEAIFSLRLDAVPLGCALGERLVALAGAAAPAATATDVLPAAAHAAAASGASVAVAAPDPREHGTAGKLLFVACDDGSVRAIDLAKREIVWTAPLVAAPTAYVADGAAPAGAAAAASSGSAAGGAAVGGAGTSAALGASSDVALAAAPAAAVVLSHSAASYESGFKALCVDCTPPAPAAAPGAPTSADASAIGGSDASATAAAAEPPRYVVAGGSDGMLALWHMPVALSPAGSAPALTRLWSGRLAPNRAEVTSVKLLPPLASCVPPRATSAAAAGGSSGSVVDAESAAPGVVRLVAGFGDGTCCIFKFAALPAGDATASAVDASGRAPPPPVPVCLLTGSNCDAVRDVSARLRPQADGAASGEAAVDQLVVAAGCNDGLARVYVLPASVAELL